MALSGHFAHLTDLMSYSVVAFSAIFFVVDPIAVVPVFITITEGDSEEKRRQMAWRACVITAAILLSFLVGGGLIFRLFSLTLAAFKIAGGILLMLTALDMLRSVTVRTRTSGKEVQEATAKPDVAIVPLAMPLLAGPGSIATVMVLTAQAQKTWQLLLLALSIIVTAAASYLMLRAASLVNRFLGNSGRAILERVMGLLLVAIAVQFMIGGVREAFPEIFAARSQKIGAAPPARPAADVIHRPPNVRFIAFNLSDGFACWGYGAANFRGPAERTSRGADRALLSHAGLGGRGR